MTVSKDMIFHLQTRSQVEKKALDTRVYFVSVTETFFKFLFIKIIYQKVP